VASQSGRLGPHAVRDRLTRFPMVAVSCLAAPAALADVTSCQRGIAKHTAYFTQKRSQLLARCEDERVLSPAGVLPCLEAPEMAARLAKLDAKVQSRVGRACRGGTVSCAGGTSGSGSVGWPPACPAFESHGCVDPSAARQDIGSCVTCAGENTVDQAISLW
jgi:hypothetical protein